MNYFSFNGISCDYVGVSLLEPVPKLIPRQRGEFVTVPGRDGQLFQDEGAADVIEISLQIWVQPRADIFYVMRWLRGAGRLKVEEGSAYSYDAIIAEGYTLTPLRDGSGYTANVPVTLQPYETLDTAQQYAIAGSGSIHNNCDRSVPCRLVLHGSGEGTVSINGRTLGFESFANGTEVDGVNREAYTGLQVVSSQMSGEWPYLDAGDNVVLLSGGVSSLEIYVQWPRV